MGYTHYWDLKQVPQNYKKQAFNAYLEIQGLLSQLPANSKTAGGYFKEEPLTLKSGDGTGKPEISAEYICFNGDRKTDLDHEGFYFEFTEKPTSFAFCKTARKPYDMAVCITLLSLANHIKGFDFSSDGGKDDWEPAITYYKEHTSSLSGNLKHCISQL